MEPPVVFKNYFIFFVLLLKITEYYRSKETNKGQGHPKGRLGKLSVRKALNPLQFSEGNFHLEHS